MQKRRRQRRQDEKILEYNKQKTKTKITRIWKYRKINGLIS